MEKIESRRNLIRFIPAGLFFLWAARPSVIALAEGSASGQNPPGQNPPGRNAPPPPYPFGPDGNLKEPTDRPLGPTEKLPDAPKKPRKDLKADESDIRKQVSLLAQYADELKKEVEKTDSTKVLSIQMLRKTQDIEKLAHHIAALATG
jgi:hypothetical protein